MINLTSIRQIFLCTQPVDMRKGFDGLSGIVRGQFEKDPTDGSLFLFVNRRRDRIKMLHWDGTGFWLYYKLLEAGTFELFQSTESHLQIDATQLNLMLAGVSLKSKRRKRFQKPN